jgi:NADH-ubiquinone oxidoreductase chain 1
LYYGSLQAFADALKLLLKEYISPAHANTILFFFGPIITLIFSLLNYLVIPFNYGLYISDFNLGIIYILGISSLATYGILLAGWSANSKYAFLGSLRSTAQLISYELILSSIILLVILLTGSLNLIVITEMQRIINFIFPIFPLFLMFFIGSIAETNRAPFDLAEAESELVSGFMTEHSASIFVFFFLAEYSSIVLLCILNSILFLGGYLTVLPINLLINLINMSNDEMINIIFLDLFSSSLYLGIKTAFLIFVFIWVRASFPRIRFDQLMFVCWTILLPLIIGYIILIPCIICSLSIISFNASVF